ncbi:phage holin family protein [Alkalihalobacterium alkalinitrilicum]|uniref:phage holin family protein n=1 Tax=Alkalihalobacterium alkalinitrilicum TaxID=427920 RepID=UPI001EE49557|nr:phage holin family protein [Alkalihalobacterium alkalinitrilicum]
MVEFFSQIQVHPQLLIVVPALMILGNILKRTPKIQDWMILWLLLFAGIISGIVTIGFTIQGIANGIIATGAAITTHQAYKQTFTKRSETDKKTIK